MISQLKKLPALLLLLLTYLGVSGQNHPGARETMWISSGPYAAFTEFKIADSTLSDTVYTMFLLVEQDEVNPVWAGYNSVFDSSGVDSAILYLDSKRDNFRNLLTTFIPNAASRFQEYQDSLSGLGGFAMMSMSSAVCENIGFEEGNYNDGGWIKRVGTIAPNGVITWAAYISGDPEPEDQFHLFNKTSTPADQDPLVSDILKIGYDDYSIRLQDRQNGARASQLERTFTVDPSSPFFAYSFALLLQDPGGGHTDDIQKPYFKVELFDQLGQPIICGDYEVFAKPPVLNMFTYEPTPGDIYYWRNWSDVIIPLTGYVGQDITIKITVADCSLGGHFAYAYLDFRCFNEEITDLGCTDGFRKLEAPGEPYAGWFWTGTGRIDGANDQPIVNVKDAGTYTVEVMGASGCRGTISKTVSGCTPTEVPCTLSISSLNTGSCDEDNNQFGISGQINLGSAASTGFIRVSVGEYTQLIRAPYGGSVINYSIPDMPSNGQSLTLKVEVFTSLNGGPEDLSCSAQQSFTAPVSCGSVTIACANCIGSFAPVAEKKYVLSAWVSEKNINQNDTTHTEPYIEIEFNGSVVYGPVAASGKIIDGWQRIYYEFEIPSGASDMAIALKTNDGEVYFDDIRVYPIDGSLVSYVYDPVTLRLAAVLDENNYATLYEYDEDGTLSRVKKETERGVLTVKESRNNNSK